MKNQMIFLNICEKEGEPAYKGIIYQSIDEIFSITTFNNEELPTFVDRVHIIIFCMIEGISLQRYRKVLLSSHWVKSLSDYDRRVLSQYQDKCKGVPNSRLRNRYYQCHQSDFIPRNMNPTRGHFMDPRFRATMCLPNKFLIMSMTWMSFILKG